MADVAYLTSLWVAPQNVFQAEGAMRGLFAALTEEEFGRGGVEAFVIHRDPDQEGAYQFYEQYASESADVRHLTGPKSRAAWEGLLARMIMPFERIRLEPIGVFGHGTGVDTDPTTDEGWRFTVRAMPDGVPVMDQTMVDIMDAMSEDEFPFGQVKSYTAHRVYGEPGRYIMYEHFTALGSARHAKGPRLTVAAGPMNRTTVTPFERKNLKPMFAFEVDHARWGLPTAGTNGHAKANGKGKDKGKGKKKASAKKG